MKRISDIVLNSLLVCSSNAENFLVRSCNDDSTNQRPAMTIEIAQDWFNNNISGQDGYTLDSENEIFTKTISEGDLNFEFSSNTDDIILSHTVPVTSMGFAISDAASINFAEDSIVFQCRYSRTINVDDLMTVESPVQPEVGRGDLTYSMAITAGALGGTTKVKITPNHSFEDVGARVESCFVSDGEHLIYAFHSFNNDDLCRDHSRLNVVQTEFGENVSFEMRTFRFITTGSRATEIQEQTVTCKLYLEPVNDVISTQQDDCLCHTETDCANTLVASASRGAVLMLATRYPSNVPVVAGFNGELDADIDFTYGPYNWRLGETVSTLASCAATLNNEMYVFGGLFVERQIAKVMDCSLTNVGEMPFGHYLGGCNTFSFGVMLCFPKTHFREGSLRECHSFDGATFKAEESSLFEHHHVGSIGNYRDSVFVTGGHEGLQTEILNYGTSTWVQSADFPFSNSYSFFNYATISTEDGVLIIGGNIGGPAILSSIVAEYKDGNWRNIGNLARPRAVFQAIKSGSQIMILGGQVIGSTSVDAEIWNLITGESEIINSTFTFPNTHYMQAAVFPVDVGFCSRN